MSPKDRRIKHVVVLMFENRSFDHMLGHLSHGKLDPITSAWTNPADPKKPNSEPCEAHFLDSDRDVSSDPGHGFEDVVRQLTEGDAPLDYGEITMRGFAWNYAQRLLSTDPKLAREIMGCHTAEQIPVLSTLAREYAVCNRWFASVPSETWPNRLFAHGAQSEQLLENDVRLYRHQTTFDILRGKKIPWAVYAGDVPQAGAYAELGDAFKDRFNRLDEFFDDVQDGTLPAYSWLEPKHFGKVDSQHPVHSVALGDQVLRRIYTALALNPEIWESLLLIVTWDEHGGFMDRVTPEKTVPPFAGRIAKNGFAFDVLGVRVPAVVISPLIPRETVDDTVYDHSSLPATIREVFGLDEHLTQRDEKANTVLPLLMLDEKRAPAVLPPAKPERMRRAVVKEAVPPDERVELDDLQRSLIELTRLLDEHRRPRLRRATPRVVEEVPQAMTPTEMDLVVTHFQHEHLGSRERRVARDA